MKRAIHSAFFLTALILSATQLIAQETLAQDQNPNYALSRDRYMRMADSLNSWHSTTIQDTYKAIDYLEDKRQARLDRQSFRRELRMERARNGYNWYNGNYWYPGNFNSYYPFYGTYNSGGYYRGRNIGRRYNNFFWNSTPTISFGWMWR